MRSTTSRSKRWGSELRSNLGIYGNDAARRFSMPPAIRTLSCMTRTAPASRSYQIPSFVFFAIGLTAIAARAASDLPVADFESDTYGPGWVTTGNAFGEGPAKGALPNQMLVSGYAGHGLVDSFHNGDAATGTLTSPPFTVERRYLNFLVGGGSHANETCVNLLVDGRVVRSATGLDDEHLEPYTWDVRELQNKPVQIQIVDASSSNNWGHINADAFVQSDIAANADTVQPAKLYHESLRPQFHFTAKENWLNDPNGLVFFDGEYHLFYQYQAAHQSTGAMSWGHAVSPDLVHWTQLPIALAPDSLGYIWSGSAVVDWKNTSGFGVNNQPPLVAMFTSAKAPFAQSIAYSTDRGRTFTKFSGNPVIPHIANENRDPHVIWYEPLHQWMVVLYKDVDETFCLFSSPDLKHWTHLQDLHMPGCSECPDFFPIPLDGDANKAKWVFTAANGRYLVGAFDGKTFTPEQSVRQVDFGQSYYAVQTFSDIPKADGRRIQIAWMRDGKYPRMPFNQQMSFPCELTLHSTPGGPRMFRYPVREIELLHGESHEWKDVAVNGEKKLDGVTGDLLDITADVELGDAKQVGLIVRGQRIVYDVAKQTLSAIGEAPLTITDGHLKLRVLVDRTSIETFANGGRVSLTSCVLPTASERGVSIFADGTTAKAHDVKVSELRSIWK